MRKYLLLTFLLLNVASLLLAQNREINGTISDATSKSPLVGVSIQSSDKGPATQSKADGSFKLTLPAGKVTLTISYVGYQKQTVTVGPSTSTVSISLEASDAGMDEVVVQRLA